MYNTVICESSIYILLQLLSKSDKHLILNNFNLHHFWWRDIRCLTRHHMTDDLMKIVKKADLQLLTSFDTITWKNHESAITMNLAFTSSWLTQQVIHCMTDSKLENNFNHHLIISLFILNIFLQILKQQYNWKKINRKKITINTQYLHMLEFLNAFLNIKTYIDYLMSFIQQLMNVTVSLIKFIKKYSCSWWFLKIKKTVQQARITCQ